MKKRILSIVLAICMLLSVMPMMAFTASAETVDHSGWTQITGTTTISANGNYYLNSDVIGNIVVNSGVTATIDLNGYVLKASGADINNNSVIVNNGTLTINDSDDTTTHYFVVGADGLWTLDTTKTSGIAVESLTQRPNTGDVIAVKGGVITGGTGSTNNYYGGGICSSSGITVNGVAICGNKAVKNGGGVYTTNIATLNSSIICGNWNPVDDGNGGGIFATSEILKCEDCTISYNSSGWGGGITISCECVLSNTKVCCNDANNSWGGGGGIKIDSQDAVLTVNGGEISDNKAVGETECYGGGINGFIATINLNGCAITNNYAKELAGGIYLWGINESIGTNLTLSGDVVIDGNTSGAETVIADNVYLDNESYRPKVNIGALTSGSCIGITLKTIERVYYDWDLEKEITENNSRFTENGAKTDEAYFFSDNPDYEDKYNTDGYLELVTGYDVTEATCTNGSVSVGGKKFANVGETVTVTPTANTGYEVEKVYYNDGTQHEITPVSGVYSFTMPETDVTVSATFKTSSSVDVCYIDENKNGTFDGIDVKYSTIAGALTVAVTTETTIRLLSDVKENVEISDDATITLDLDGKTLSGNSGTSIITNNGNLTLENGTISGGNAVNGGAIYNNGISDISNVTFTGNTATNGGAVFNYTGSSIDLKMTGCTLTENEATNGGAVYLNDFGAKAKATFNNCLITENEATENGGGCYFGTDTWVIMNSCTVKKNTAENGGGIMHKHTSDAVSDDKNASQDKFALLNTEVSENHATKYGGIYFQKTQESCFVKGTLVSMADGSTKRIEDVKEGNIVKTFDHETGKVSSAKVYLSFKEQLEPQETFKLNFDGGFSVHCVASHTFLEKDSRKYKTFNASNAEGYIGKYFYGEDGQWHKLESVSIEEKTEWLYEIYTAEHQNAFTNGMLSAPADVDYLLNIYELDENLKANEAQLKADIEKYGLVTFKYANENYGMSKEWYDCGAKYLFVAIGKGLTSLPELEALYAENFDTDSVLDEELFVTDSYTPLLGANDSSSSSFDSSDFYGNDEYRGKLLIGDGTKITANTEGVGNTQSNLYLHAYYSSSVDSFISIYGTLSNVDIGVAIDSATGKFTTNGTVADLQYFTSDCKDYTVAYNESGYLELVSISNISEDVSGIKCNASLTLKDNIDVTLQVKNIPSADSDKLKIYVDGLLMDSTLTDGATGTFSVSIAPDKMSTMGHIVVVYDNVQVKNIRSVIINYCNAVFKANETDSAKYGKLADVCKAVLYYGKYAEDFANENTASTLNDGVDFTLMTPDKAKVDPTLSSKITKAGATLDIDSTISLIFYVNSSIALTEDNVVVVNNIDDGEKVVNDDKLTRLSVEEVDKDGYNYKITVSGIYAEQMSREYTLTVDGDDTFKITYGVNEYCTEAQTTFADNETLTSLCKAIYTYGDAAKAFSDSISA